MDTHFGLNTEESFPLVKWFYALARISGSLPITLDALPITVNFLR